MTLRADPTLKAAYDAALAAWDSARSTERLWAKDSSVWTAGGEERWLGWLDAVGVSSSDVRELDRRVHAAAPESIRDVLLIGMGGSSLAPEVIARTLPNRPHGRAIRVLDSTHPTAVHDAFGATNWRETLTVVASKSGSTLEPDILLAAALAASRAQIGAGAPRNVLAITDPGSRLASQARELGFADTVLGEPTIGGRFSALSPFGLVHVVLSGVDADEFLGSARSMADACRARAGENPGVLLGAFLGVAARAGRDKCTLLLPPGFVALGAWIEQLVAESTGKHGVAILPIDGEATGDPSVYGADRAFVHVRHAEHDVHAAAAARFAAAGHPVFTIDAPPAAALAGEFFRWEFATAVAGALLGVNPFDQPDVEAAKVATRALTEAYERGDRPAAADVGGPGALTALLELVSKGDYFGILAFLPMRAEVERVLQRLRGRVRNARRVATTLGFGPRYLHSTGQAFKGGPATGVFAVLTWDAPNDIPVPGRALTFGQVVSAQAVGDCAVLRERGRRVAHVHLKGNLQQALEELDRAVAAAIG